MTLNLDNKKIQKERTKKGLSRHELAVLCDIPLDELIALENNSKKFPDSLNKISKALDLKL